MKNTGYPVRVSVEAYALARAESRRTGRPIIEIISLAVLEKLGGSSAEVRPQAG